MPNWCMNSMVVYGSPTEVKDFHEKLQRAWKKGDELRHWHLYQIYEEFGYAEDYILKSDENGYIRGNFVDLEKEIHEDKGECYFQLQYESAWGSMYEGFDWLLKRHYNTLKQVTIAEECGCEVYINTDTTGRFFSDRFVVDAEDSDTEYFEKEEQVVRYFNEYLVEDEKDKCKSLSDCYELCENERYEDKYIQIHEYSAD